MDFFLVRLFFIQPEHRKIRNRKNSVFGQLSRSDTSTEVLKKKLKEIENYCIKKLNPLTPLHLNQELN